MHGGGGEASLSLPVVGLILFPLASGVRGMMRLGKQAFEKQPGRQKMLTSVLDSFGNLFLFLMLCLLTDWKTCLILETVDLEVIVFSAASEEQHKSLRILGLWFVGLRILYWGGLLKW